ncbi:hypothetical protein D3C79_537520 [compost metagenome]
MNLGVDIGCGDSQDPGVGLEADKVGEVKGWPQLGSCLRWQDVKARRLAWPLPALLIDLEQCVP